jgi:hypothetical protein
MGDFRRERLGREGNLRQSAHNRLSGTSEVELLIAE